MKYRTFKATIEMEFHIPVEDEIRELWYHTTDVTRIVEAMFFLEEGKTREIKNITETGEVGEF